MPSAFPARLFFCAESALPALCDERRVTHVVSIGWPVVDDPTRVRARRARRWERRGHHERIATAGGRKGADVARSSRAQGRVGADDVLSIALADEELADLLSIAPEATAFARGALAAREDAVVAVHCHAGVSRSSAVVAAYLMREEGLGCEEALEAVEAAGGCPNDGFRAQLEMWEAMGARATTASESYKLWSVAKIARERDERGYLEATSVMRDPGAEGAVEDPFGGGWVSCRKCRRRLARGAHVLPHAHGQGIDAFTWKTKRKEEARGETNWSASKQCSSMFVAPLSWMKGIEDGDGGPTSGKLACPRCDVKIGAFDWAGIQCSCGAWVTPAFQIQRSKVDAHGF